MGMPLKNKADYIIRVLDEIEPDRGPFLTYNSDYGLLIAIMLSAQCTDKKVNKVTDVLFDKYKTLESLDKASLEDIESIIKSLGLYKNKAKNIKSITKELLSKYNGVVPFEKEKLVTLAGVGNKTANVFDIEFYKIPQFPVDTHVRRVSNRFGLVNTDNVEEIEEKLRKIFPKEKWISLHHQFIQFGRDYCKAQNPLCENCRFKDICTLKK